MVRLWLNFCSITDLIYNLEFNNIFYLTTYLILKTLFLSSDIEGRESF